MSTNKNRQNLLLTRDAIRQASQQTRLLYGAAVKEVRERARLTQDEVAERADVSARTIRNIETGAVAGQAEKLISIFIALGVDLDGQMYTVDMQRHLHLLGSLISRIDVDYRDDAVMRAAVMFADEIVAHPSPEVAALPDNVHSLSTARLLKQADNALRREVIPDDDLAAASESADTREDDRTDGDFL